MWVVQRAVSHEERGPTPGVGTGWLTASVKIADPPPSGSPAAMPDGWNQPHILASDPDLPALIARSSRSDHGP
jgi:hypothetical protein